MTQGQIVETERVKRQMTQADLGEMLGVKALAIRNIEKGKSHLTKAKIKLLSECWGIDEEVLRNGNSEPYTDPRRNENGKLISKKRANNKYQANHYDYFKLRFSIGEREKYQRIAEEQGCSFNQFCLDAIKEKAGV